VPPSNAGVADEDAGAVLVHLRVEAFLEVHERPARGEFEPATGEVVGGLLDVGEILNYCHRLVSSLRRAWGPGDESIYRHQCRECKQLSWLFFAFFRLLKAVSRFCTSIHQHVGQRFLVGTAGAVTERT